MWQVGWGQAGLGSQVNWGNWAQLHSSLTLSRLAQAYSHGRGRVQKKVEVCNICQGLGLNWHSFTLTALYWQIKITKPAYIQVIEKWTLPLNGRHIARNVHKEGKNLGLLQSVYQSDIMYLLQHHIRRNTMSGCPTISDVKLRYLDEVSMLWICGMMLWCTATLCAIVLVS